jgi:hypothetical protein
MVSLDESRRLLGPIAEGKTDEEVLAMRNAFYDVARVIVQGYIASKSQPSSDFHPIDEVTSRGVTQSQSGMTSPRKAVDHPSFARRLRARRSGLHSVR